MKQQEKQKKLSLSQETLKNLNDPRSLSVSINTCHTVACTVCHTC